MTTLTQTLATTKTGLLPIIAALVIGISLVYVAGHVQAHALHSAAHDARHAAGFPCH
ncbi:MAG: hypothetical protein COC23_03195 [Hyphomicrobiales bacterium]|nr:MAG: hypothetical protein COC23_03195 [Hyphomicrobiales bacterium]